MGFSQPQQLCDSFCPSWLIFLLWLQAPLGQQWSSCTRSSGQPRPSFLCMSRPGSRPASGALSGLALPLLAPSPSKNMPFHRKFHFHSPGLFMLFPSSNITEECLTSSPPVNPVFASCHPYLPALPPAPPFFTNYLLSLASDDPDMLNSCPWNLLCPPALGLRCSVSVRTRARSWLPKTSFVGSQTLLHMRLPWGNGSTPPPGWVTPCTHEVRASEGGGQAAAVFKYPQVIPLCKVWAPGTECCAEGGQSHSQPSRVWGTDRASEL